MLTTTATKILPAPMPPLQLGTGASPYGIYLEYAIVPVSIPSERAGYMSKAIKPARLRLELSAKSRAEEHAQRLVVLLFDLRCKSPLRKGKRGYHLPPRHVAHRCQRRHIFLGEALEAEVMALEPYFIHTQIERLKNKDDTMFYEHAQSEAMVITDTEPLDGVDCNNDVLGYVTLGVDTTTIKNGTANRPTGEAISSASSS
ncbi:hypothetical protein AC579_10311 [Pseudocercospora musae]|uniref:Uncharacterized protein n=1 Tax=Pseudocercospora musae TaxID=113226 RepID=A0A139I2P8_9PEZI|nr:hypothetical protein AC579_10311 [Pseudocercospora musae]